MLGVFVASWGLWVWNGVLGHIGGAWGVLGASWGASWGCIGGVFGHLGALQCFVGYTLDIHGRSVNYRVASFLGASMATL